MDVTHLHLVLTHFPIVGTILGAGLLIYGLLIKNSAVQKAAYLIFIFMSLLTIPVFNSGEVAEETVEHLAGISERTIHQHEESAEIAIWWMAVLGVMSFIGMFLKSGGRVFKVMAYVLLILSLVTSSFFIWVGNEGGKIRHTEITSSSNGIPNMVNPNSASHDEDD